MQFGIIRVVPREYNVPSLCWDGAFLLPGSSSSGSFLCRRKSYHSWRLLNGYESER